MNKKIRHEVFETNSSSQHSLIYKHTGRRPSELEIDPEDNSLVIHIGDFTEERGQIWTQQDKLGYLFTYFVIKEGYEDYIPELLAELLLSNSSNNQWNQFSKLQQCLLNYTNCSGIKIVKDSEPNIHNILKATFAEHLFYGFSSLDEDGFLDFVFDDNIGIDVSFD